MIYNIDTYTQFLPKNTKNIPNTLALLLKVETLFLFFSFFHITQTCCNVSYSVL